MKAIKYQFHEHGVGYQKGRFLQPWRPQFSVIVSWIKKNSSVLDVGCGDGVLGEKLIKEKHCQVTGVDLDKNAVAEAKRHKIQTKIWDVDKGLPYHDNGFDVVVCNELLQYVDDPNFVVSEILRVGKTAVISFPNFGFWFYRLQFLFGRFPSLSLFGHQWWEAHLTRYFAIKDFFHLPAMKNVEVLKQVTVNWRNRKPSFLGQYFPNFFGRSIILKVTKK